MSRLHSPFFSIRNLVFLFAERRVSDSGPPSRESSKEHSTRSGRLSTSSISGSQPLTRLARLLNQRPSFTPSDEIPRRLSWERYVTKSANDGFLKYRQDSTWPRGPEKEIGPRPGCSRPGPAGAGSSPWTFIATRHVPRQITHELLLSCNSSILGHRMAFMASRWETKVRIIPDILFDRGTIGYTLQR